MRYLKLITGVIFEPKKTFETIVVKRSWLAMYMLVVLLTCAASFTLVTRMDAETFVRKSIASTPLAKRIPESQVAEMARRQSPASRYIAIAFLPIGMLLNYFFISLILFCVFILATKDITLKKSMAITVWSMGVPHLVLMLSAIPVLLLKQPTTLEIDPAANVIAGLGLLVLNSGHPFMAYLLTSIDVFSFWSVFLLATGFSVASYDRISRVKATSGIAMLWFIGILINASIRASLM